jgi:hypothetical protein
MTQESKNHRRGHEYNVRNSSFAVARFSGPCKNHFAFGKKNHAVELCRVAIRPDPTSDLVHHHNANEMHGGGTRVMSSVGNPATVAPHLCNQ